MTNPSTFFFSIRLYVEREKEGKVIQLINGYKLMKYAKEKGLVLPAFNITNYELTATIIKGYQSTGLGGILLFLPVI